LDGVAAWAPPARRDADEDADEDAEELDRVVVVVVVAPWPSVRGPASALEASAVVGVVALAPVPR
jgi:hypothetical protein